MANDPTVLHGPATDQSLWLRAMEAQLHGIKLLDYLLRNTAADQRQPIDMILDRKVMTLSGLDKQWAVDRDIMVNATPFAWGADPITAVLTAAKSMPGEARINAWNLETNAAWWFFDIPLPVQTVSDEDAHVHALSFGWINRTLGATVLPAFVVTCWIPDPQAREHAGWMGRFGQLMPSQVWTWFEDDTLDAMLDNCAKQHRRVYGPGGRLSKVGAVGETIFIRATEVLSRFILAGFAWMNQRIIDTTDGTLPRQRRKEFHRHVTHESLVKIVQLRKATRVHEVGTDTPSEPGNWTCRWEVDGHWRNQPCGPRFQDRRITWINPFLKGPEGLPLRVPKHKVYQVTR